MDRRRVVIGWARRIVADPRVIFLDTETTGVRHDDEVIEIALLDTAGRVLFESLVRPTRPIDPAAVRIHGIDQSMLAHAPEWPLVYREVMTVLRHSTGVVTYNAAFDQRLVRQSCAIHGLLLPRIEWHCAMRRFAEYAGPPLIDSWRSYHRLAEALERLGLVHPGTHRARGDAEACRRLVLGMARGLPPR